MFGSEANEFGNEANEFENELLKSGNVEDRDDVMQLGRMPAKVQWRPLERILCYAKRLNESLSKFACEVSKLFVSQFTQCA